MIPNANDFARRRQVIGTIFRMLSVGPLLLGFAIVMNQVVRTIQYAWMDVGAEMAIVISVEIATTIAIWAILFYLCPKLAGIFVPSRGQLSCPFCNYQLEGLTEPRCPECGKPLTPEFMGLPPAHLGTGTSEPDAVMIERHRSLMVMWLRFTGWSLLPFSAPTFFLPAVIAVGLYFTGESEWFIPGYFAVGAGLPFLGFTLLLAFRARRISRWIVPKLGKDDARTSEILDAGSPRTEAPTEGHEA